MIQTAIESVTNGIIIEKYCGACGAFFGCNKRASMAISDLQVAGEK